MTAATTRRLGVVAATGWMAFAVVWLQQPPTMQPLPGAHSAAAAFSPLPAPPPPPRATPMGNTVGETVVEIPLGPTPKMLGSSFLPPCVLH